MQEAKKIATIMYWANLLKMPIDELRGVISDVTKGKSNSRKNLSYSDYLEVISRLKQAWRASEAYLRGKNMRAKIIATMCEIGYKTNDNLPDYDRMNTFFEKHGAVKKPFTEMNFSELQKTVNQVTRMKENYQKPKTVEYDLDNKPYK
jgi:hypothetical protein